MSKRYDPVVVKEQRDRMNKSMAAARGGVAAANALLWWDDYGEGKPFSSVGKVEVTLFDREISGGATMLTYIHAALQEAMPTILAAAVGMAEDEVTLNHKDSVPSKDQAK